jgi:hypothetical protein
MSDHSAEQKRLCSKIGDILKSADPSVILTAKLTIAAWHLTVTNSPSVSRPNNVRKRRQR